MVRLKLALPLAARPPFSQDLGTICSMWLFSKRVFDEGPKIVENSSGYHLLRALDGDQLTSAEI